MDAIPDRRCCSPTMVGLLLLAVLLRAAPASTQTTANAVQSLGTVVGEVTDQAGAPVAGARITLASPDRTVELETASSADGRFSFVNVAGGPFRLTVSAAGFAPSTLSGDLSPGEAAVLPPVRLTLSGGSIDVEVSPTRVEIAEQQLKVQERQRLFGVFPNFTVSYDPDAVPLNTRQKFRLTWKSIADPTRFGTTALAAGIQQARNDFSGFGSGSEGYAKRYAALYATALTDTMISRAVMPAVFRQDPRYFYKGTGSTSSRVGYALSRAVVRRGDNGRAQPDYSRIVGHLTAGAISNLYYPAENRQAIHLTLVNTALAVGGAAIDNVMQEFVLKRLTKNARQSHRGPQRAVCARWGGE